MSRVVRLLYRLLEPNLTLTTNEAKADWLAKYVQDMRNYLVFPVYSLCGACAYMRHDDDVFKMLVARESPNIQKMRATLLDAIKISLKSKEHVCMPSCSRYKADLDMATTITRSRTTGEIFYVKHEMVKQK